MRTMVHRSTHKALVFDLDGTFYPYYFCEMKYKQFAIFAVMHYWNCSEEQAVEILSDACIAPFSKSKIVKSLTDLVVNHGTSVQEWDSFREKHYVLNGFENCETVKLSTLEILKQHYKLFLVSNNTIKTIQHILESMHIPIALFDEVYSSTNMVQNGKKKEKDYIYIQICQDYNLLPEEMVAIGDRYTVDVQPMLHIGGDGFVVDTPSDIDKVAEILLS